MTNLKTCNWCKEEKTYDDFYYWKGKYRGECRVCRSLKNAAYQKKIKAWKKRTIDPEKRRRYSRTYYAKNKERFKRYRALFLERNPGYHLRRNRRLREEKKSGQP